MPTAWKSRLRSLAINLTVLLLTFVFLTAILELGIRLTGLQPMNEDPHLAEKSSIPGLVYEIPKNLSIKGHGGKQVTTNNLGFRSPEIDASKPLIVMLGDSMTFGYGVADDQSNPAQLQRLLPDSFVLNAGTIAYNIEQETLLYEGKIAKLNPVMVILEFIQNDIEPKLKYNVHGFLAGDDRTRQEQERDLAAAINGPGTWHIPGKYFLHTHSALFTFIERRTKGMWFRSPVSIFRGEWTGEQFAFYQSWFERLTKSIGDRPKIFVMWPDGSLHPETDLKIQELARRHDWHIFNLQDVFGYTYPTLGWDYHPSAATQKRMATVLAKYLKKYDLLPK